MYHGRSEDEQVEQATIIVNSSISEKCPCCGRLSEEDTNDDNFVGFDYNRNIVFNKERKLYLTPREADILKVLLDKWPKVTYLDSMITIVWGSYTDKIPNDNVVHVTMSTLRHSLNFLGIDVICVTRRGYILVKTEGDKGNEANSVICDLLLKNFGKVISYKELIEAIYGEGIDGIGVAKGITARVAKINKIKKWNIETLDDPTISVRRPIGIRLISMPKDEK